MAFGHNSNVTVAGTTYHVQTEERGPAQALIDTTVYFRGRVLHRRTNRFHDLLPLNAQREEVLKLRVEEQHHGVIEEIRSGKLTLPVPQDERTAMPAGAPAAAPVSDLLHLELLNAKTWLSGKRALLQIAVRDQALKAVEGATVTARVEGAAQPAAFFTETGSFGHAQFEFDMPHLTGPEAALVIEASKGKARVHLRFQLRAKPRVPSAS
jgi:hypothetical protein